MKYLKALLVVVITACTFGSAMARSGAPCFAAVIVLRSDAVGIVHPWLVEPGRRAIIASLPPR